MRKCEWSLIKHLFFKWSQIFVHFLFTLITLFVCWSFAHFAVYEWSHINKGLSQYTLQKHLVHNSEIRNFPITRNFKWRYFSFSFQCAWCYLLLCSLIPCCLILREVATKVSFQKLFSPTTYQLLIWLQHIINYLSLLLKKTKVL